MTISNTLSDGRPRMDVAKEFMAQRVHRDQPWPETELAVEKFCQEQKLTTEDGRLIRISILAIADADYEANGNQMKRCRRQGLNTYCFLAGGDPLPMPSACERGMKPRRKKRKTQRTIGFVSAGGRTWLQI